MSKRPRMGRINNITAVDILFNLNNYRNIKKLNKHICQVREVLSSEMQREYEEICDSEMT